MKIEVFFFASGFHTIQIDVHENLFKVDWSIAEIALRQAINAHFKVATRIYIFGIKKL